jgi:hypothetical protein
MVSLGLVLQLYRFDCDSWNASKEQVMLVSPLFHRRGQRKHFGGRNSDYGQDEGCCFVDLPLVGRMPSFIKRK